jgi:hypothetical protein
VAETRSRIARAFSTSPACWQASEDLAGGVEIELPHQADAPVVLADEVIPGMPLDWRARAADDDEQSHHGDQPACSPCKRITIQNLQEAPV